jgi:hypothetical protein
MASERQILANRRNAQKSTGPRSATGKNRVSSNAFRHGLRSTRPTCSDARRLMGQFAVQLARGSQDPSVRHWAQAAAGAIFDLDRIRHSKVLWIDQASYTEHGIESERAPLTKGHGLLTATQPASGKQRLGCELPQAASRSEPQQTAEAVRRVLPQLQIFQEYERRAASRRDKALRLMHVALVGSEAEDFRQTKPILNIQINRLGSRIGFA